MTIAPSPIRPACSFLFVPADSEKKLAKGAGTAADALILDLEDAVAPSRRPSSQPGSQPSRQPSRQPSSRPRG